MTLTLRCCVYFYPRSPCGERLISPHSTPDNGNFYPRSPCGERLIGPLIFNVQPRFLSTLSLRRATSRAANCQHRSHISIHALLAESDAVVYNIVFMPGQFLSTLSLRRATAVTSVARVATTVISIHALLAESDRQITQTYRAKIIISIHALLAESDLSMGLDGRFKLYFYPRSPCGERR